MLESIEIGLKLLLSKCVSLLKMGTTLAILHIFRNTQFVNYLFIMVTNGMEIVSWIFKDICGYAIQS